MKKTVADGHGGAASCGMIDEEANAEAAFSANRLCTDNRTPA